VDSDGIYVTTTAGVIHRYDLDGTPEITRDLSSTMENDLLIISGTLYVAPNSANLYALNASNLTYKWTPNAHTLDAPNTGAPYATTDGVIYLAVGTKLQAVTDNGTNSANTWGSSFEASGTIDGGPVETGGYVYFGRDGGRYYALDATDGSLVTDWPYTGANGDANVGPWVDPSSNKVIFATDGENLDAFTLE